MKKTILYSICMIIISILLFLLKITGMKLHIVLGILALLITIVYTLLIRVVILLFKIRRNAL